jgi:enamine deaminase RidA (YjgF/YER057c/UK114 family)
VQRVVLDNLPRPPVGCHAVAAGDLVFVGGLLPSDFQTGIAPGARPASSLPLVDDGARAQGEYIVRTAASTLNACGLSFRDVVRIDQFVTDRRAAAPYLRARREAFPLARRPASSLLHIQGLPVPEACVSAELVAARATVPKEGIFTDAAPVNFPGAPHGAKAGPFVFVQGQIASDFANTIAPAAAPSPYWYETAIERETAYVLDRLATILDAAGSSLQDIVKAHVYLTNLSDFCEFDRVWARYFPVDRPARTIVPVVSLGSPACHVEIKVVALSRGTARRYISTADGSSNDAATDPEAVLASDYLFLSGLVAGDLRNGLAQEVRVPQGARYLVSEIELQVRYVLERARRVCAVAGTSLSNLVSAQVHFRDLDDYYNFAQTWNMVLGEDQPVVTALLTPEGGLCPGACVAIDLTAYAPQPVAATQTPEKDT